MLEFRILGPLEVVDDEAPLRLGGPKERATLAILLLNANRVVSIDRLADDLYAGAPPATAVTQVQRQISELRKTGPHRALADRRPDSKAGHDGAGTHRRGHPPRSACQARIQTSRCLPRLEIG